MWYMSRKKVLVIGATGYVGKHLVRTFLKNEFDVVASSTKLTLDKELQSWWLKKGKEQKKEMGEVSFCQLDLMEEDALCEFLESHSFDYIVNTAGAHGYQGEQVLKDINVTCTENLVSALKKLENKPPLLHVSSIHALSEDYTKEEGRNLYGQTKRKGEILLQEYAESSGAIVNIIRATNIWGGKEQPTKAFWPELMRKLTSTNPNESPMNIFANGHIPFLHVRDLCFAVLSLVQQKVRVSKPVVADDSWSPKIGGKGSVLFLTQDLLKRLNQPIEMKNVNIKDEGSYKEIPKEQRWFTTHFMEERKAKLTSEHQAKRQESFVRNTLKLK